MGFWGFGGGVALTRTKVVPQNESVEDQGRFGDPPATHRAAPRSLLRCAHQKHQQKKDALQSEVAAFGPEPLLRGVGAAAHAAPADGNGGMPSESGMLASVEEQSRCERMPRWASTARTNAGWRRRPAARRPGASRSPSASPTLPPVARWFSISRARSTAADSASTSSSIFSLLSERISTLARAVWGMALTLEPPSISPTLTADLGAPSRRVSANSATARHSACSGLPTPKSLQLWPPGPVKATSKRRLPSARLVMWSVLAPSTTTKASICLASGDCLHRWRMPSRLPSPSSPTLAASSRPQRELGQLATPFQARAMASKRGQAGAVIGDAGAAEAAVGSTEISSFAAGRDHGIEVRGKGHVGRSPSAAITLPARSMEASHRRGTVPETTRRVRSRKVGAGTRHSCRWTSLIHWLLARKPLEAFAHAAVVGEFIEAGRPAPPCWQALPMQCNSVAARGRPPDHCAGRASTPVCAEAICEGRRTGVLPVDRLGSRAFGWLRQSLRSRFAPLARRPFSVPSLCSHSRMCAVKLYSLSVDMRY